MKTCITCGINESPKWRKSICNKCYMHEYMKEYKKTHDWKKYSNKYKKQYQDGSDEYKQLRKIKTHIYEEFRGKFITRRMSLGRSKAKSRGLEWLITIEEYHILILQPCHYCNNELGDPVEKGIGLDRIDNSKGYTIDNVLSCCAVCNVIRSDKLSKEEMEAVAKLIISMRK